MKRTIIDILLLVAMLVEYSKVYLSPQIHEIVGICLIVLVAMHLILNRKYIKAISKGRYSKKRSLELIINLGFFIAFIMTCIFGILSSREILPFLNIGNLSIIYLHKIIAYTCIILLGMHLGITLKKIFKKIPGKYAVFPAIIICGIYSCIQVDFFTHLTGKSGFSMVNGNILINSLKYLSIVLMIAVIVNLIYSRLS